MTILKKNPSSRLRKQDGGFSIIRPIMMLISFKYLEVTEILLNFAKEKLHSAI